MPQSPQRQDVSSAPGACIRLQPSGLVQFMTLCMCRTNNYAVPLRHPCPREMAGDYQPVGLYGTIRGETRRGQMLWPPYDCGDEVKRGNLEGLGTTVAADHRVGCLASGVENRRLGRL